MDVQLGFCWDDGCCPLLTQICPKDLLRGAAPGKFISMSNGFLSRRDFIKLSGAALLSLFLSELHLDKVQAVQAPMQGRVVYRSLIVRAAPSFNGVQINSVLRDSILDIIDQVHGGADGDYNRTWYQIENGSFVYSGGVQPVKSLLESAHSRNPLNRGGG